MPTHPPTAADLAAELERLAAEYPDLPREALLKEAILTSGLSFSADALRLCRDKKTKSYFIFSFDMVPIAAMEKDEHRHAPEEIRFHGGAAAYRPTVVSVRVNPASPLRVEAAANSLALRLGEEDVAAIELLPSPGYYQRALRSGQPVHEVAPTIEWGYLIYLTVYRKCQYFGFNEECRFCDINANYRQQVAAGRPYRTVKPIEDVLEALAIIAQTDDQSRAYTITGGSITRHLQGQREAEFYASYARAIEGRFAGRWIGKMVAQALPEDDQKRFRDAGIRIYHPNFEVWDAGLFEKICPGKAAYIGQREWFRRILAAREIFGAENVIPNFVAGIEMSRPHGFAAVDDALASTGAGLEWFMSQGVVPRFTTWCPEPLSELGSSQGPAPLAYHVGLLRVWRDTHRRHRLPVPPGYGPPGPGRALFSVSAFMDVIEAPTPAEPPAVPTGAHAP
ncbi:MAG: radical SAM protein [Planctomycetes bacterium]|nr:radical SAM protein [Planctomycetota bacterium]